jgi:hypothetical protein
LAGLGRRRRVDVAVGGGGQEHQVGHAGVELLGQDLLGPGGFGGGVVEAAGGEAVGDAAPDGAGQGHEQHGDDENGTGAARGQVREARQHW